MSDGRLARSVPEAEAGRVLVSLDLLRSDGRRPSHRVRRVGPRRGGDRGRPLGPAGHVDGHPLGHLGDELRSQPHHHRGGGDAPRCSSTVRPRVSSAGTAPRTIARIARVRGVDTTEFAYDASFLSGPGWAVSPDLPIHAGRSAFPLFTASDGVAVHPQSQELRSSYAASSRPRDPSGATRRGCTRFGPAVRRSCGCVVSGGGAVGGGDGDVLAVGWRCVPA